MGNNIEQIKLESFREICQKELNRKNFYFAQWVEEWEARTANNKTAEAHPWSKKGREFINFCETFYKILSWYPLHRINNFRDLGWTIDSKVVKNIKNEFTRLITFALSCDSNVHSSNFFKSYDPEIMAHYTAIDYTFQNLTGKKINNVLDFGSGIGRQAFQWCRNEEVNFFSVDAIESMYMLQNNIYSILYPKKLREYFYAPERFRNKNFYLSKGNLFHLPTWNLSLLPDAYFDMIICVQVLQEINEVALNFVLGEFRRVIKKGGLLYIRDNEFFQPEHKIRVGRELLKQRWVLAFKYTGKEGRDIEGVPRLWAFTNTDNSSYFNLKNKVKRALLPARFIRNYKFWKDYELPI